MRPTRVALASILYTALSATAFAGPIVIAGTDADDHGSVSAGVNLNGWEFMQKAFENLSTGVTNGGTNIVCLGCNGSTAQAAFDSAVNLSSIAGTYNEVSINAVADITAFLTGGSVGGVSQANTGIIYMNSGGNVGGGFDNGQIAAVNAQAAALNNFVQGGGGLFTQSQAANAGGFGWLTTLLPGLVVQTGIFDSTNLQVTADGVAAFPGLTNADMTNATPWHNWFSGNFGGLSVLTTGNGDGAGGFNDAVILGGGAGTVIVCGQPGAPACPVPEPSSLLLFGSGLASALVAAARRKVS